MSKSDNIRRRTLLAALAMAASTVGFAQTDSPATSYPQKVVKVIVPYTPGSGTDKLARILAERLGTKLGQSFIVENKAGASGLIGTQFVANAPADGYTLMVAPPTHVITSVLRKTPYDPVKDFEPVGQIARSSVVLVTHPSTAVRTLQDMLALLKAQGDNPTYSSPGAGSTLHLYTAQFQLAVGSKMRHVPGKGVPGAVMDVVQNNVTLGMVPIESALPLLKAGRLKALAQTGKIRSSNLPDVPTFAEAGVSGYSPELWTALFAPAGTPKPVIERLNKEVTAVLATREVQELLATNGYDVATGSPQQLGSLVKTEFATWSDLVKRTGIKAE